MMLKVGIGQDSHRFATPGKEEKKLIIGGVVFEGYPPFLSNSDGDVVLHAITNAISGITGKNILGDIADRMCEEGIKDSKEYVKVALSYLKNYKIVHVSISIEGKMPKISPHIDEMKKNIAKLLNIDKKNIGITATSGEELTPFGKGEGVQAIVIITALEEK